MRGAPAHHLNRGRTVVLWGLAVVWISEMLLSGVRPLTESWTRFWDYLAPDDPRLYLAEAIISAAKGALGVLAVYAIRSRSPFVRAALFIPMALVPPLNVAFPFRAQGFLLRPTLIGTTLSVILWQTFFLLKDDAEGMPRAMRSSSLTPWDAYQYAWFAASALVLTLGAVAFLFAPAVSVRLVFPCITNAGSPGLTLTAMVVGTHLTAVATATWIGAFFVRRNATIRTAVAAANTLHAAILCALPLSQLALQGGTRCVTSSPLIVALPLLAGWLLYGALSHQTTLTGESRLRLVNPAGD